MTYGEQELIASLRHKDEQAFSYLYDHYSGTLYGVICQIVENTELGNDVLQEAFINIWRHIDSYDETKGRLFTWMLNIARNAAIDKIRSKGNKQTQRQVAIPNNDSLPLSVSPRLDDFGLKKIILKLKDEQRQLIDLSYFQGFTHEQIAKALDIPLGTVKTRIRSALTQLRSLLS
ncbi:RNA polymerase sigma factor [Flavisolibacter ginsengisoli]|jgi:RNA polymerase sigma-70 factor (ECF subfamily)|uniref:RNA polymerase sigma-70 factor, ECF subfamily n=1 Tax=Flavisolibacter ginsengisoli DSM 18119 TaxID=1121884 RepID=A0A1M4VT36_9BACT|nr:sigma-70 family RNA polymerase sigma factor [Flavisolibacter ginsengisoli]SHE72098.1 RNA polymerase sigma-70 factor, ECF subfamily [Flavisolibacter ginsengisoli DSM 18119]